VWAKGCDPPLKVMGAKVRKYTISGKGEVSPKGMGKGKRAQIRREFFVENREKGNIWVKSPRTGKKRLEGPNPGCKVDERKLGM